jgi:hypothetical protein
MEPLVERRRRRGIACQTQRRRSRDEGRQTYSFDDDWRSFGSLITECLGVRVEPSGAIVLPEGMDASYVDSSERALLKSLFVPTRQDVNDATSVGRAIRDILASTPHTRAVGNGTFILAVAPNGIADAVYTATDGQIATNELEANLSSFEPTWPEACHC